MRLGNPLYEFLQSVIHPGQYPLLAGRVPYLIHYTLWWAAARFGGRRPWPREERFTVILLSYERVRNMDPFVRNLLRSSCVGHIVVSNNNPDYRIEEWIHVRDERVRLIDQPRRTPPGIRFELARSSPGDFFLSIDDDLLLYPRQVERLLEELVAAPEVPHGVQGQAYVPEEEVLARSRSRDGWLPGLRGDREVDVINCVYAFTRQHVERMYQLAGALGMEVAGIRNGEDVLLSASGRGRPRIHDMGRLNQCLSWSRVGVATWRTLDGFQQERLKLYESLLPLARELGHLSGKVVE